MTVSPVNITTDTGLSAEMKTYYAKKMIENLYGRMVYNMFGKPGVIPNNSGKTIEWRRLAKLKKDLTPLSEGVTPAGENLTVTTVSATVTQNGKPVYYSDVLKTTTIDPILDEALKDTIPGNALEVLEAKASEVCSAGTNVMYAGSNVARATVQDTDVLTALIVKKAVRNLKRNSVPTFPDGFYRAIIHPDAVFDIGEDDDFKLPHQYQERIKGGIYPSEIGLFCGVRFFESPLAKKFGHQGAGTDALHTTLDGSAAAGAQTIPLTSTTGLSAGDVCTIRDATGYFEQEVTIDTVSAGVSVDIIEELDFSFASADSFDKGDDVFATLVFGPNAYGIAQIVGLQGNKKLGSTSFEIIIKGLDTGGSENPLNQRGSIAWKAADKTVILDQARIIRLEHGATDAVS